MTTPFWKMSGARNDFVLLEGLPRGSKGAALARRLCDRRSGIGADGLLVVSRRGGRPRLDYWNSDGSAAFCGNGSRCAALWAAAKGWAKGPRFVLDTSRGPLEARLTARGRAEVAMPSPKDFRRGPRLTTANRAWATHFIDTGVPHAVVFVPDVETVDVRTLGRALRFHKAFGKAGANADFVSIKAEVLSLRTYERGVEDETLACGTGVVAAAAAARSLGKAGDRVLVRVRGGETLRVTFSDGKTWLEGPGTITFTGEVPL
ncbi:MAG: diaminopimelate epimerase [Elusimicrobiota bacterium]